MAHICTLVLAQWTQLDTTRNSQGNKLGKAMYLEGAVGEAHDAYLHTQANAGGSKLDVPVALHSMGRGGRFPHTRTPIHDTL